MRIERDQLWTAVALAAMVAGSAGGLWYPTWSQQHHLLEAVESVKEASAQGKSDVHHLAVLAQEVADIHKSMEVRRRVVPQDANLADLLKSISASLSSLHVTDQETQSQATITGSDFSVIPVSLRFRGTFPTVYGFLSKIEAMHRLVRITRLEISDPPGIAPDSNGEASLLDVNVELCTFFAPSETSKP